MYIPLKFFFHKGLRAIQKNDILFFEPIYIYLEPSLQLDVTRVSDKVIRRRVA